MIHYLLKFVSKDCYADFLLDGKMLMRQAKYFRALEEGRGDMMEAALSHDICMYGDSDYLIYCLSCVEEDDIQNGVYRIDEKLIKDFDCENGYLVLIDFKEFKKNLRYSETCGYSLDGGKIQYGKIPFRLMDYLFRNPGANLFIKRPAFKYQKEYRLVVYRNNLSEFICKISDMRQYAQKIAITSLPRESDQYLLRLP